MTPVCVYRELAVVVLSSTLHGTGVKLQNIRTFATLLRIQLCVYKACTGHRRLITTNPVRILKYNRKWKL